MTLCGMCGNEFEGASSCPFCGTFQHTISSGRSKRRRRITTVNVEHGRPVVEDAIARLEREIAAARMKGVQLIRVIHGWGSSGAGGAIRDAVRSRLHHLVRSRSVRGFVPGDDYSELTNAGRDLIARHPSLRASLKTDRENPGITFVELP